jgi:hypothetical protein
VGLLASALAAPVVPCGLAGTERLLADCLSGARRGALLYAAARRLRRGPVVVAFGAPLSVESGEAPAAFTARLQAACFALNQTAEAVRTDLLLSAR